MTIAHPRRLRTEPALPAVLHEALRELPNAAPDRAQLDDMRRKLGLPIPVSLALVQPLLIPDRRSRERRLRRTVVALLFFPIAATAAVGSVVELRERRELSAAAVATSAAALARSRKPRTFAQPSRPLVATPVESSVVPSAAFDDVPASAPADSAASVPRRVHAIPNAALGAGLAAPDARPAEPAPIATEVELLQRATAALRGNPTQALALVAEHRQRFPAGNLAQEREVIAIKALVGLGDSAHARDSLVRFERAYPRSAYVLELHQIID